MGGQRCSTSLAGTFRQAWAVWFNSLLITDIIYYIEYRIAQNFLIRTNFLSVCSPQTPPGELRGLAAQDLRIDHQTLCVCVFVCACMCTCVHACVCVCVCEPQITTEHRQEGLSAADSALGWRLLAAGQSWSSSCARRGSSCPSAPESTSPQI